MPALWKRSRRAGFRVVVVVCALAVVAYGAAAVTAVPAQADQPVSTGGPFTLTEPSGDLVASVDVAGVAPADMTSFLSTYWPEAVGLSAGASLSDVTRATWQKYSSTWAEDPSTEGFAEPPSVPGMSATVISDGAGGSTVTVDIPSAEVHANWDVPSWLQPVIAAVIGIGAAGLTFGLCQIGVVALSIGGMVTAGPGGGLVLGGLGTVFCSGLATGAWTAAALVASHMMAHEPWSAKDIAGIVIASVLAALGGAAVAKMWPGIRWVIKKVFSGLYSAASTLLGWLKPYLGPAWENFVDTFKRLFGRGRQGVADEVELLPLPGGLGEELFPEGFFQNFSPSSSVTSLCMDAGYGLSGDAAIGQPVAINECSGGSQGQLWDVYADGMVSAYGLCLDTKGGTSPSGTARVNLESCDGSSSQTWTQVGSTVVNQANSECLDDPGGDTTAGTQLDVAPCDGSAAQHWLSPAGKPCDIYAVHGTACVAAYSTTRAMYAGYDGPLYQVTRVSDGTTRDIGLLNPGGDVDASEQDSFCQTSCTITTIYDQTPDGNNLTPGPGGGAAPAPDKPADAAALPITIGGHHKAYGVDIAGGMGYRDDATLGVATGSEPEGMYMVASGTNVNDRCCFDFGNAEAHNNDTGGGHMDAVNFGLHCFTDYGATCSGSGPWVAADLENGLFQGGGNGTNPNHYTGNNSDFVTAMLKNNGTKTFALSSGDSQSGGLTTWYDGNLPDPAKGNMWAPMSKEGAIILGIGGDNSNGSVGSFFEGVMTAGYPSDAADAAVQANIVAAGYGGNSAGNSATSQVAGPAVVHSAGATGAGASGYTSVFTVDAKNGHLQEAYLTNMGARWATQDLSATGGDLPGTPPVKPDTRPVAVVHCGYTSVFTVDASDNHLQETYLPAIGGPWHTQDLSATGGDLPGTPPTKVTPTAVVHFAGATGPAAACGYTSVYTIDAANGHLRETYLPLLGGPWSTQDLTAQTPAPPAQPGTSPVSIVHDGYVSVFTVGTAHDIWETYLSNIGNPTWAAHDLTAISQPPGPQTTTTVTAVVHQGYLSVYAAGDPQRHLWELYLPAIGGAWHSQDLSATGTDLPGTPPVAPGTAPVALYHTGYTSVFTVDQASMDLRETYLSNIGNTWASHDLSATGGTLSGTPHTTETPMVVVHPDTSGALTWTSVFTINQFDNDLQESYLPSVGSSWVTQDLTFMTSGPPVMADASPTATWSVANDGYTYVFKVDPSSGDLVVSYLTAMGAAWQTKDLTAALQAPKPIGGTTPVAVAWDGQVSVFTVGDTNGDLWETTLPANGGTWTGTNITATTHGPTTAVTPAAVFHGGYLSAYTVDDGANSSNSGDLEEYYLPAGSSTWQMQDLSSGRPHTPQVSPAADPVALYHDGYTSVYTMDNDSNHLQETYLASIGGNWATQDLSAVGGAPTLADFSSPTALYHSGYTSVYEVDGNGHVWETYLTAIGNSWASQDLTAKYSVPNVPTFLNLVGTPLDIPSYVSALYHSGYASIYTIDRSGDVHESFLPAISDSWQTQDLTQNASPHIPGTNSEFQPSPLVHYDTAGGLTWTSLFTLNSPSQSLQETYLQKIGGTWISQGLPG